MTAIVAGQGLGLVNTSLGLLGDAGQLGSAGQGRSGEKVYVNASNGNLVVRQQDEWLVAAGPDVGLTRTYNSGATEDGDNNDNWRLGFARSIVVAPDGASLIRTAEDGNRSTFVSAGANHWIGKEGSGSYDSIDLDPATGVLTWTDGDTQLKETYQLSGSTFRLATVTDADGKTLTLSYDANGLITQIADGSADLLKISYYAGTRDIQDITTESKPNADGTGTTKVLKRVSYTYDGSHRLATVSVDLTPDVTNDSSVYKTTYTYGSNNKLATISQSDASGQVTSSVLSISYYSDGRVQYMVDWRGSSDASLVTSFAYSGNVTTVTMSSGSATPAASETRTYKLTYDTNTGLRNQQLSSVQVLDAYAQPVSLSAFTYDTDGNVLTTTDGRGMVTSYTYDANGNRKYERDAEGNVVRRSYSADGKNLLLSETRYTGLDTDGAGPGDATDPQTTRYAYDANNHLRFVVTADGRVTEHTYNAAGSANNSGGLRSATVQYDSLYATAAGWPVSQLVLSGMTEWTVGKVRAQRAEYVYNYRGQLSKTTTYEVLQASGAGDATKATSVVQYIYDQSGNLLQSIDGNTKSTYFDYDGLNRVKFTKDGENNPVTTVYLDTASGGPQTVFQRANGRASVEVTDAAGRVIGAYEYGPPGLMAQANYTYDKLGQLRKVIASGQATYFLYDTAGHKVGEISPERELTLYVYNGNGQLTASIRRSTLVDPSKLTGDQLSLAAVDPGSNAADRYGFSAYDKAGRLLRSIDASGAVVQYAYDGMGRLTGTTAYANRLSADQQMGLLKASAQAYATNGWATELVEALNPLVTSVTADAANDRVTRQFYDNDGHLLATLDAEGTLTESSYDASGRLTQTRRYATPTVAAQRAAGTLVQLRPAASDTSDALSVFFYDARGLLAGSFVASGYSTAPGNVGHLGYLTGFTYDGAGNRSIEVRYATPVVYSTGKTLSQLVPDETDPQKPLPPTNQKTYYSYDGNNRVKTVTTITKAQEAAGFSNGSTTAYVYDAAGNLTETVQAWGAAEQRSTRRRYDALGRVTHELGGVGVQKLVAAATVPEQEAVWNTYGTRYFYDADGRMTATYTPNGTDANGNRTVYYYDKDGRLTHSINMLGEVVKYGYNNFGERTAEKHYAGRIAWNTLVYLAGGLNTDAVLAAALASSDMTSAAAQDAETFTQYSLRGEAESLTDALGNVNTRSYTAFGQLEKRQDKVDSGYSSTTKYTYNRTGQRRLQTEDQGGVSERVTELTYDSFGRLLTSKDGRANTTGYAYDRLGRTVTVTDPTNVQRTTAYDAFSRVVTTTDGDGKSTNFVYDALKREMKMTTPEGVETITETNREGQTVKVTVRQAGDSLQRVSVYEYDADGRVLSVTQAQGTTAQYKTSTEYDKAGRAWKITDARNVITEISYDAASRVLTRVVDPGPVESALNLKTEYYYDGKGLNTWIKDPNGVWTKNEYDRKGQLLAVTVDPGDPQVANSTGLSLRTEYTYDARGSTLTVAQGVDTTKQDALERYAKALVTRHVYDGLGRRVQEIVDSRRSPLISAYPGAGDDRSAALNLVTTYVYDGNDNVVARIDPLGKVTRYVFDADNRQILAVDATGAVTQTGYDRAGRATSVTTFAKRISLNGLANVATRADIATRLGAADPTADQVSYRIYEDGGRLKYSVDARNFVTQYAYDAAGNVVKTTRYANAGTVTRQSNPGGVSADYAFYDVAVPADVNGNDRVEQTVYDAANRAIYSIDALLGVTRRRYDAAGNVIEVRRYLAPMTNTLTTNGAVTVGTDPNVDQVTRTVYDKANRATFTIDAESYVTQTGYDKVGRITSQTRFAGTLQGSFVDNVEPKVISAGDQIPSGSYVVRVLAGATTQDALTEYGYDKGGRLGYTKSASGAAEVVTVGRGYDKAGRLIGLYESGGAPEETATIYGYDGAGRLISETRDDGRAGASTTRYVLDQGGNRAQIIGSNGVALAESADAWAVAARQALGYAADAVTLTDVQKDALKTRYTTYQDFDDVGRVIKVTDALRGATSTEYDAFGNAVKVTDPKGVSGYFYFDKRNQSVLHVDPVGNAVATEFGAFGTTDKITRYVNGLVGTPKVGKPPAVVTSAPGTSPEGGYILAVDASTLEGDQVTTIKHDKLDRQTEITDAAGGIEKTSYDRLGNRSTLTNKLNGVFNYTYDRLGRVKTETLPVEAVKLTTTGAIERNPATGLPLTVQVINEYTYDARGNKTKLVEAKGLYEQRTTEYAYDRLNRLVRQTGEPVDIYSVDKGAQMAQRPVETRRYDTRGNLIEVSDPNGARTLTFYDGLNRRTGEIRATTLNSDGTQSGTYTAYDYDDAGNLLAQYVYGTPTVLPAAGGVRPAAPGGEVRTTAYAYDANNRLVETRIANITVGEISVDTGNYEIHKQDLVTRREYDKNGNVVVETDARGGKVYSFFSNAGTRVAQIDADRYLTVWAYDSAGHVVLEYRFGQPVDPGVPLSPDTQLDTLTFSSDENTRTTTYKLDKLGRVLEQTVFNIQAASVDDTGAVTIEPSTGNLTATTFYQYDALGNVTRKTEATGEVLGWDYDQQGRLVTVKGAPFVPVGGSTAVTPATNTEYNGLSLVLRRLERGADQGEADDRITSFTYDRNGLMASQIDAAGAVKLYAYDAAGHQTKAASPRYTGDALQGPGKLYLDRVNVASGSWAQLNGTSSFAWSTGLTYSSEVTLGEPSVNRNFMVGLQNVPTGDGLSLDIGSFQRHDAYFVGNEVWVSSFKNGQGADVKMARVPAQSPEPTLKPNATYVVEIKVLYLSNQYVSRLTVYEKGTDPATQGCWTHDVVYGPTPWAQARIHSANQQNGGLFSRDAIDNIKVVNGAQTLFSESFDDLAAASGKFAVANPGYKAYWVMDSHGQSLYSTVDVLETQYDLAGREVKRRSYSNAGGVAGKLVVDKRQPNAVDTWSEMSSASPVSFTNGSVLSAEVTLGNEASTRNFMLGVQNTPPSSAGGAGFRRFDAYFVNNDLCYAINYGNGQVTSAAIAPAGALRANCTYQVEIKLVYANNVYTYQLRVYEKGQTTAVWSKDFNFDATPWTQHYVHAASLSSTKTGGTGDSIDNIRVVNGTTTAFSESFGSSSTSSLVFTNSAGLLRIQGEEDVSTWETRYDAYGQVTAKGRNGGWQETAQYDAAGRVTRATGPDGVPKIFLADANGNITLTLKPPASGDTATAVTQIFNAATPLSEQDFRTLMGYGGNATVSGYSARNQLTDTFETKADQLLASLNAVNLTMGGRAALPYDVDPPAAVLTAGQSVKINFQMSSTFNSTWTGGGSGNDRTVQTLNNNLHLEISKSNMAGTQYRVVVHFDAGHYHKHGKGYIQPLDRSWDIDDPTGSAPTVVDLAFLRQKTADYRSDYGETYGANYTVTIYKITDAQNQQLKHVASFAGQIPGPRLPPFTLIKGWQQIGRSNRPITERITSVTLASGYNAQTPNPRELTFSSLPGGTSRVYLQYRIKNQAPAAWSTTTLPVTGTSVVFNEDFLKAIGSTAIPAGVDTALEFNLYAVNADGKVISAQSGEVAVTRDTTTPQPGYAYSSVLTGLKVLQGQWGQMFLSADKLTYAPPVLAKDQPTPASATIRYRLVGQTAWLSPAVPDDEIGSPVDIGQTQPAGWFKFKPPAFANGQVHEYVIDFKDKTGRITSSVTGYLTAQSGTTPAGNYQAYLSTPLGGYERRPSLMQFSNVPPTATSAELSYKLTRYTVDAQGNAVVAGSTTGSATDLQRGADGNFTWDADTAALDPASRYVIDFTFAAKNGTQTVATLVGRENIVLQQTEVPAGIRTRSVAASETTSPVFHVSGPKIKLVHSEDIGKVARKAYLFYRKAGSTDAYTAVPVVNGTVNASGVVEAFNFNLSGFTTDLDVYYYYETATGTRVTGNFSFAAGTAGSLTVATLAGAEGLKAPPNGYVANIFSANSAASPSFRISGTTVRLVHDEEIGKVASKAYLYWRDASKPSDYYNTIGPVSGTANANGVVEYFEFNLAALQSGEYTDLDVYYRYENSANVTIVGSTQAGTLNSGAPTQAMPVLLRLMPQAAYEVAASNIGIAMVGLASSATAAHRQQVYNAYGEVVQEYTPMALDRIRRREEQLGRSLTSAERAAYGTTLRYDGAGKLIEKLEAKTSVVQASGTKIDDYRSSTKYVYDKQGRLIKQIDANGNATSFLLRKAGNGERVVLKEFNAEYNASLDAAITPVGGWTTYAYDIFGDLRRKTVEAGTDDVVFDYAYDKMHRVVRVDQPAEAGGVRPTDLYFYDSAGNRVAHQTSPDAAANAGGSFGDGTVRVHTDRTYYDAQGRVVKSVSAEGLQTTTSYQVKDGYDYRKVVDENGKTSEEWMDYAGRVRQRINQGGRRYRNLYNLAGNLTAQIEVNAFTDTAAKSGGQNITYEYYGDGTLKQLKDVALGTVSTYGYDLNGNKTSEGYQNSSGSLVYQASNATYDELGRIRTIIDTRYAVTYTYDKVGNRRSVVAKQVGGSTGTGPDDVTTTYWYSYDRLNRLSVSMGDLNGTAPAVDDGVNRIVKGTTKGVQLGYDLAGNRALAEYASGVTEYYKYTVGGHLTEVRSGTVSGPLVSARTNDLLGRVKEYLEYRTASTPYTDKQVFTYDADSHVVRTVSTSTKADSPVVVTDTSYSEVPTMALPNGGPKTGLQQWSKTVSTPTSGAATTTFTKYTYAYYDNAQQLEIRVEATNPDIKQATWGLWAKGVSKFDYDVNGHVKYVGDSLNGTGTDLRNIAFINNAQGLILNRTETGATGNPPSQSYFYFDGRRVGEWGNNPGIGSLDYSTAMAMPVAQNPKDRYRNIGPITSNFDQNYQPINATYPSFVPGGYKVRDASETLQSIARAVWGDASMWYLIAEANGFTSATQQPRVGQLLVIPNKVTNFHNTSQTFKVYNAGEVMGDVAPTLPDAPFPPLPKLDGGCGVLGQIIMIVVAVVATIATAGVLAGPMGVATTGVTGVMSTGMAALGAGTLNAVALGAVAGAVGSIASQVVGLAIGAIDEFSWSGVALGAIGGAASAGAGGLVSEAGIFGKVGSFAHTVASGALGNAISQGVGVVTGLQQKFSWTGVAAAAVGSAVSFGVKDSALGAALKDIGGDVMMKTVAGMANGAVRSVIFDQKPNWASIAVESFGQALGDSVVGAIAQEAGDWQQGQAGGGRGFVNPPLATETSMSTIAWSPGEAGGGRGFINPSEADIAAAVAALDPETVAEAAPQRGRKPDPSPSKRRKAEPTARSKGGQTSDQLQLLPSTGSAGSGLTLDVAPSAINIEFDVFKLPISVRESVPMWSKTKADIDAALDIANMRKQPASVQLEVLDRLIEARHNLLSEGEALKYSRDGVLSIKAYGSLLQDEQSIGSAIRIQYLNAKVTGALEYGIYPEELEGFAGGRFNIGKGFSAERFAFREAENFSSIYGKAPAAKIEIDRMADDIADLFGGTVAKAPIKSRERALEKIENDYRGDASRIKDLARNTIIVEAGKIDAVAAELARRGATVKIIKAADNALGYSGINATVKTKAGIYSEIQVNSPEMIYAKESANLARSLLGDGTYNSVASRVNVPGGQGHLLYEQYRVLSPASMAAQNIAQQSRAYYDAVRNSNGR